MGSEATEYRGTISYESDGFWHWRIYTRLGKKVISGWTDTQWGARRAVKKWLKYHVIEVIEG